MLLVSLEGTGKPRMNQTLLPKTLSPQAALIYTMVLVSAAEGDMSEPGMVIMGDIINHLPIFRGFDVSHLAETANACADLLADEDGIDQALALIKDALPTRLRETAYALACDVAAADGEASQEELRFLEMLRDELEIERLSAAAIERGARARYRFA